MMALTMMLVALMVCITLGIGMKAREKVETQTLADASAYSGAVMTARTFNSIALLNRVAVAEMVSMIATQSLTSYAGYYKTMVYAARDEFQNRRNTCTNVLPCLWCNRWDALLNAANAEINRVEAQWPGYDGATNAHIRALQGAVGGIHNAQVTLYSDLMTGQLVGTGRPPLANAIAQRVDQASAWQGELTAEASADPVNQRELGQAAGCDPTAPQPICTDDRPVEVALQATLGTRYYQLETDAANLSSTVEDSILFHHPLSRASGENVQVSLFQGSTRFVSALLQHGPPGTMGLMGEAMEGQMAISVMSNGCSDTIAPTRIESFVYTTSVDNANATHLFRYTTSTGATVTLPAEPLAIHSLGPCPPNVTPPCGMWPGYVDLNPGHVDPGQRFTHLYGQPKVTAVIQRDYRVRGNRADPWNLLYSFTVRPGNPETFDNNGLQTAQGLDISRQTAVATGLVYYHRMNHWREPPNFFNPYWHATLVSGAIDLDGNPSRGGTDLQTAVSGAPFAQDVINQLAQQGFRGWQ